MAARALARAIHDWLLNAIDVAWNLLIRSAPGSLIYNRVNDAPSKLLIVGVSPSFILRLPGCCQDISDQLCQHGDTVTA